MAAYPLESIPRVVVRRRIGALRRVSVVHVYDDAGHCSADFRAGGVFSGERAEEIAAAVVEQVDWEGGGAVALGGSRSVDADGDGCAVAGGDAVVGPSYFGIEVCLLLVLRGVEYDKVDSDLPSDFTACAETVSRLELVRSWSFCTSESRVGLGPGRATSGVEATSLSHSGLGAP